ncbi:MAG: ABC-type transporter Mla MlaB component [Candidatus Aldehydirespiratoraceae bacterium]
MTSTVISAAAQVDELVIFRQESPIVFIDATAISSIDSTGFDALRTLSHELKAKGVELWTVNPSIRKAALVAEEADIVAVTLPRWFQHRDEVLAVFRQLGSDDASSGAKSDES